VWDEHGRPAPAPRIEVVPMSGLYDADYRRRRQLLVVWALSHPGEARCWQCGQTLATCGPNRDGRHRNGARAKWTAGHVLDGDPASQLALECSPCNYRRGAEHGNRQRPHRPLRRPGPPPGRGIRLRP
jgi:hypothetical protein